MPNKMNYRLRNEVWERDHESCQECNKNLYKIETIEPFKEISEELYARKELFIYKWETDCWKCKKKTTKVSYFLDRPFSYHIGDIEKLDKILMEKYPFVKKVFSKTRGEEVIANTCIHCGRLQGNWFITEEIILDLVNEGLENYVDIKIPITLTPEDLDISEEDPHYKERVDIERFGHVHHIDGDRSNNKLENLILLCPSCHKKADIERKKKHKKT